MMISAPPRGKRKKQFKINYKLGTTWRNPPSLPSARFFGSSSPPPSKFRFGLFSVPNVTFLQGKKLRKGKFEE